LKPVPRILKNLLNRLIRNNSLSSKLPFFFSLDISCENEGCTAIIKLDVLVNHLIDCEYSPKKLIQCDNGCGMTILKDDQPVKFYLIK